MAGRYRAPGAPSTTITGQRGPGRHTAETRSFAGTPLTVQGITRDAMGAASLMGSSIPKGPLAPALAASHGAAANTLAGNQSFAQADIATVVAQLDALSKSRSLRAAARNAEATPASSTPLNIRSPRLLSHGRGPRISVMGLTAGDLATVVAIFEKYGYTVNRAFTPSRLDVMTKMSYWKTAEASIQGAVPQARRQSIAQAFDRGVTVWNNIADIGTDVTSTNTPVSGISY
jgi:hypothetical protein